MSSGPPEMGVGWLSSYEGLSLDAAVELAEAEGRRFRVVRPGEPQIANHAPSRVNLVLDDTGLLVRIHAG